LAPLNTDSSGVKETSFKCIGALTDWQGPGLQWHSGHCVVPRCICAFKHIRQPGS